MSDVFTANAEEFEEQDPQEKTEKAGKKQEPEEPDFEIEIEDTVVDTAKPGTDQTVEYRFPETDDVPEVLRGKSAKDVPGLFATMQQLTNNALQAAQRANAQPQPVESKAQEEISFTEDDFGVGADPDKFQQKLNKKLEEFAQAKMQPFVISQLIQSSQMAHNQAKSLPYWDLFGPHIEQFMGQQRVDVTSQYGNWEALHDRMVRENMPHVMQFEQQKRAKPAPGFSETNKGTDNQNGGAKNNKRKVKVTREQAAIADAMGVPVASIVPFID
jgi:hypothetical protein